MTMWGDGAVDNPNHGAVEYEQSPSCERAHGDNAEPEEAARTDSRLTPDVSIHVSRLTTHKSKLRTKNNAQRQ